MKATPMAWMTAALMLVLLVGWWRHESLQAELMEVRNLVERAREVPREAFTPARDEPVPAAVEMPRRIGLPSEDRTSEADRILDLERVVHAQADLIEDLLARFAAMDEAARKAAARAWGPEQVVGAPDTMTAGDHRTAWAPAAADGGIEWLEAEFAEPSELSQVIVRQTCNPGAITKVVAIAETGSEIPIWEGKDPSRGQALADTPFGVPAGVHARKVKVYLDTSLMPGWEEIDAMQVVGRDGSRQWAKSVQASSTYASGARNYNLGMRVLEGGGTMEFIPLSGGTMDFFPVPDSLEGLSR